jgi:hypothetical protein
MGDKLLMTFVCILLVIGSILLYKVINTKECTDRIVYKNLPRTFLQEQNNPTKVSDVFSGMFLNDTTRPA